MSEKHLEGRLSLGSVARWPKLAGRGLDASSIRKRSGTIIRDIDRGDKYYDRARARIARRSGVFARARPARSIIGIVGLQLQDAVVTIAEIVSQIPFVAGRTRTFSPAAP